MPPSCSSAYPSLAVISLKAPQNQSQEIMILDKAFLVVDEDTLCILGITSISDTQPFRTLSADTNDLAAANGRDIQEPEVQARMHPR